MGDAAKLLERLRRSSANAKREELIALYEAFGFEIRHGKNHDLAVHPKFPMLRATIARHNSLAVGYFKTAVKLIDTLTAKREAK